jgi:type IV pilus assembly protein PilM
MRILGIDVGNKSIKAVELDTAFGRYEIHEYHETPLNPTLEPAQAVSDALESLLRGLPRPPDKISVALSSSQVTFRNLKLPTRDRKGIATTVQFEIEDELPFPLEDAVFDYAILSQSKQGSSIHVAATLARHVAARLSTFVGAGIDPDLLTTEAWAYRNLVNRVLNPAAQETPVLLLDMGHDRTVLYIHLKGAPALVREIPWGGRDITLALSQKFQTTLEQAEQIKINLAQPSAQGMPSQAEAIETVREALLPLIAELRQIDLACRSTTHMSLGGVFSCGGSSLLPGLGEVIQNVLHHPVQKLQALSSVAMSGVTYSEQTDATFVLASSLALCLVGNDRGNTINLRKGEFAKVGQTRELNLSLFKKPLIAAGAVLACLILSLTIQSFAYQSQLKDTDARLEKSIKSFFAGISNSALRSYMSNTSSLRKSVDKELTKQRELSKLTTPNPHSPIEFLRDLSSSIKKDVVVDMTQFQVGAAPMQGFSAKSDAQTSLTFLVANPQMAEQLATILGGKISGLQRSKMEETPAQDGTKRWKITFTGKAMESAYGK